MDIVNRTHPPHQSLCSQRILNTFAKIGAAPRTRRGDTPRFQDRFTAQLQAYPQSAEELHQPSYRV